MSELSLPWPPKVLSPNARTHWSVRSKAAKLYRSECYILAKQFIHAGGFAGLPADGTLHLWLDFYPPDRRHRDDDNITAAFKSGRDGLAEALGINDKRFRTHPWIKDAVAGMVKVRITGGPDQPTNGGQTA
jgi:crossover junction endodeoxyribonuclease RusA